MSKVADMPTSPTESNFLRRLTGSLTALVLALSLAGCSMVRLGYGQLPELTYWWVDSYLDLDDAQSAALRTDLAKLHDWHRSQELLPLAQTLAQLQATALQDTMPAAICRVADELRPRLQALADQATPTLARLAVSLTPAQLTHLQHQFAKRQKSWRDDWLSNDPVERLAKRSKRLIDRSEMFYGRLDDAQRALLRASVLASRFEPKLMQAEMLRRQQDIWHTAQTLALSGLNAQRAEDDTRQLLSRLMRSPDAAYRQHAEVLSLEGCQTFMALHNSTSAAQKQKLAETLRVYELDARALMPALNGKR